MEIKILTSTTESKVFYTCPVEQKEKEVVVFLKIDFRTKRYSIDSDMNGSFSFKEISRNNKNSNDIRLVAILEAIKNAVEFAEKEISKYEIETSN
jgi:hypothetical protein